MQIYSNENVLCVYVRSSESSHWGDTHTRTHTLIRLNKKNNDFEANELSVSREFKNPGLRVRDIQATSSMRTLVLAVLCFIFVVTPLIMGRRIKKKAVDTSEDGKYEASIEITPGSVTFPSSHKEYSTHTKIYPMWSPRACCCRPCYDYDEIPYPYRNSMRN